MNNLSIYCDGGSRRNPGPAACAFVIKDQDGKIVHQEGKYLGIATNNVAEYNGVLSALSWLKNNYNNYNNYNFYLDSLLVVSQLNEIFKIKDSNLRRLFFRIKLLEKDINKNIIYTHIPREKNTKADLLVNYTLDKNLTK